MTTPLVELTGVSKRFGGARALIDVDLRIDPGEVHGLLGQNGSGKSTLLKVLSGFHEPDAGTLTVRGEPVGLPLGPGVFRTLGFAFVHQDLALVPSLSVTENLIVSRLAGRGRISWRRENSRRRAAKAPTGSRASTRGRRSRGSPRCSARWSRWCERSRSCAPTATPPACSCSTSRPRSCHASGSSGSSSWSVTRAGGGSVLFVTHDLDEVREVCDRVTVLRDGRRAGTAEVAGTSVEDLVEMIIGHRLERRAPERREAAGGAIALRGRGIAGASSAGSTSTSPAARCSGSRGCSARASKSSCMCCSAPARDQARSRSAASVEVGALTPRRAMDLGMGFVPADRPLDAVIGSLSVTDNVTMTTLAAHRGRLGLSRARLRATAAEIGERHAVIPNRPELPLQALSGGNQQKAVLGKWLRIDPPVLLLDQPTQGVDVRAREQIFSAVRAAAARGTAVVCASADYEELAGLCDRVLVLARGAVALELSGDELTKERIAEQVLTSTSAGDALATN